MCGVEMDVENDRIVAIRPNRDHVATQGYSCVKGTSFLDTQYSPDRILTPQKREGTTWRPVSWEQALSEIGAKLREIRARHGGESIAHWSGAASGVNVVAPIFRGAFFEAIGSHAMYGNASLDCSNKFRVCEDMYGSPFRLPFPDVDRSRFLMFIGANPVVSGTSLFHLPHSIRRLRRVVRKGGRVVFLNPRRTETSVAGEQIFIRPDTDLFFLLAFLGEIFREGLYDADAVRRNMKGLEALEALTRDWTPERQAAVTGVPADLLRGLVRDHHRAGAAALYMSTGVNQGRSGSLCFWLQEAINAVSGNLDREGGSLMGSRGVVDFAAEGKKSGQTQRAVWRADGLPSIVGAQPSNLFADDVLGEGGPSIRALFVEAANPVLVAPNPRGHLTRALEELELLVAIDPFRNETGNLAHYILPTPFFTERADIPYALQSMAGNMTIPYVTYSDAVVDPPAGVRPEWWIWTRLAEAAGVKLFGSTPLHALAQWNARAAIHPLGRRLALTPERVISMMLTRAGLPSARRMARDYPDGLRLPDNRAGHFLGTERVLTDDGLVHLAPEELIDAARQVDALYEEELARRDTLKLISKRELRSLNSWMRNNPSLARDDTNYLYVHPEDARRFGLEDGAMARVSSSEGSLRVPVRVSDEMMIGTVALPFGWGHADADGLSLAKRKPGVNVNALFPDGRGSIDPLSGMAFLSGLPVTLTPAEANAAAG
jgi:anaerobic selenocysteine-containing dehydrogenase